MVSEGDETNAKNNCPCEVRYKEGHFSKARLVCEHIKRILGRINFPEEVEVTNARVVAKVK